jgi:hypothetical protein
MVALPARYVPPLGQVVGWTFRFRFARLLSPITLHDGVTELHRQEVIVQMAEGNPPGMTRGKGPAHFVIGLWGGLLDNTKLAITADPQTGSVAGALEF